MATNTNAISLRERAALPRRPRSAARMRGLEKQDSALVAENY